MTRTAKFVPGEYVGGTHPDKELGVLALLAVLYTASMSGSYGLEAAVAAGGPFLTIVSLLVIPVFWGLPTALSITELSCAIPSNAGATMWVNAAFNSTITGAVTYVTLLLNFVDNSLYPTVFADYFAAVFRLDKYERMGVQIAFIWMCAYVNMIGVRLVSFISIGIMVATFAPFVIMFLVQLPQGFDWERISDVPASVNWALFLPVVCWNFSGFDSAGNITEEVKDPSKVMPRALILLVIAGVLTYVPPVLVGASVPALRSLAWSEWGDGFWVQVGRALGGDVLGNIVLLGSTASTLGMMTAVITTTSRSLAGAGQVGFFPKRMSRWLATYHRTLHTPVNAIFVNCAVTTLLCLTSGFDALVEADQVLYAMRLSAIMAAFLKLRIAFPSLPRPFVVPGGFAGAIVCGLVPLLFSVGLIIVSVVSSTRAAMVTIGVIIFSLSASYIMFHCFGHDIELKPCIAYDDDDEVEGNKRIDEKTHLLAVATSAASPLPEGDGAALHHRKASEREH